MRKSRQLLGVAFGWGLLLGWLSFGTYVLSLKKTSRALTQETAQLRQQVKAEKLSRLYHQILYQEQEQALSKFRREKIQIGKELNFLRNEIDRVERED